MSYKEIITNLYFLLIYADNDVNEKETIAAREMMKTEDINEEVFNVQIKFLSKVDKQRLYNETLRALKQLGRKEQIRTIAWLCLAANADGFMDKSEWELIYKLYHKELNLPLNEIFTVQKELNKLVWERSLQTSKTS